MCLASGLIASRRYSRYARRLRRGDLSAGSRCSLMSDCVLRRHALAVACSRQAGVGTANGATIVYGQGGAIGGRTSGGVVWT